MSSTKNKLLSGGLVIGSDSGKRDRAVSSYRQNLPGLAQPAFEQCKNVTDADKINCGDSYCRAREKRGT